MGMHLGPGVIKRFFLSGFAVVQNWVFFGGSLFALTLQNSMVVDRAVAERDVNYRKPNHRNG